jgi:hypothetical protein
MQIVSKGLTFCLLSIRDLNFLVAVALVETLKKYLYILDIDSTTDKYYPNMRNRKYVPNDEKETLLCHTTL